MTFGSLRHLGRCLTVALLTGTGFLSAPASARDFLAGADISSLAVHENHGAVYRDNNVVGDAIEILRDHGTNWFRLRLFVDPVFKNNYDGSFDAHVAQDLNYTIALAQRIKAAGGKLLLDFHYSDTWADPGHQWKPAAWRDIDSLSGLANQVYDYTKESIEAFKAAGVMPEMVQIGNEISSGMLWNGEYESNVNNSTVGGANTGYPWTGGSHNTGFSRLATLLSAGINGARDAADPGDEPLIMIHHDKGSDWSATSYYFNQLLPRLQSNGTDIDVIGYSYYPRYHAGGLDAVQTNLNNTVATFGKPVMIAETGFPYSSQTSAESALGYSNNQAGQQQFLADLVDVVQNVPNEMGLGVFWWYAEARPTPDLFVWQNGRYGLFSSNGNVLPVASVFEQFLPTGDFNNDGIVDAADYTVWRNNLGNPYDETHYAIWKQNYGMTFPTGSGSLTSTPQSPVPEPATLALLSLAAALLPVRFPRA